MQILDIAFVLLRRIKDSSVIERASWRDKDGVFKIQLDELQDLCEMAASHFERNIAPTLKPKLKSKMSMNWILKKKKKFQKVS